MQDTFRLTIRLMWLQKVITVLASSVKAAPNKLLMISLGFEYYIVVRYMALQMLGLIS